MMDQELVTRHPMVQPKFSGKPDTEESPAAASAPVLLPLHKITFMLFRKLVS